MHNNVKLTQSIYQKHLSIIQDSELTFENHLKMVTIKINKTIGLLRILQKPITKNRFNNDL